MKYEPLERHLRENPADAVELTFREIEAILGAKLPPSARRHPAWWSNNPTNHVNAQAWLGAGYRAERVDVKGEGLLFRRVSAPPRVVRHPILGCLKGTVTIMPGVDLTGPADPEWGKLYE